MADELHCNSPANADLAYADMTVSAKSESEFWCVAPRFSGGGGDSWDKFNNNFRNTSR